MLLLLSTSLMMVYHENSMKMHEIEDKYIQTRNYRQRKIKNL
jgi:hypothetical protein